MEFNMDTLFTVQNIRMIQRTAIATMFAVALTACGGGGGGSTTTSTSIEDQVIALHVKIDAGQITEETFISQLAALVG
jgi:hypothetical protein